MRKAALLLISGLVLAACGVDGPPVPPGQTNPDTAQSIDEIRAPI